MRSIRSITKIEITEKGDIGEGLHSAHSEPFFYESAYQYVDRPDSMSIDECGRYRPECEVSEQEGDSIPRTWKCSSKCLDIVTNQLLWEKLKIRMLKKFRFLSNIKLLPPIETVWSLNFRASTPTLYVKNKMAEASLLPKKEKNSSSAIVGCFF